MRRFYRLSISQKLLVITMVPTVSALVVAFLLILVFDVSSLRQTLIEQTQLSASFVADQVDDALIEGEAGVADARLKMLRRNEQVSAACLFDAEGKVLASYFRDRRPLALPASAAGKPELYFSGRALHLFHPILAMNQTAGTLYLRADQAYFRPHAIEYVLAMCLVLMVSTGLAFLLSSRLQRLISGPMRHLALLTKVVSEDGDYSVRAVKHGDDELGHLVDQFNGMLEQIEHRDQAVQAAHDQLEDRVNERTLELQREIREHKATTTSLQREISEHMATEAKLKDAQLEAEKASQMKGEFLANMSHELRTPLNGIIGMAELLHTTRLSPVQQKYTDTIRRSGRSLLTIIGDILDYSKIEAGLLAIEPTPMDLLEACEEVVEILNSQAAAKKLPLVLRYSPDCPRMYLGDGLRIRQVLINLAGNALKFTQHGHVYLTVAALQSNEEEVTVQIGVEDTGIGTSKDKLEKIFGQYSQASASIAREYGGTGLGLPICKQLVKLMGGRIGVKTREGVGSRFYFTLTLPLDHERQAPPRGSEVLQEVPVLVVSTHTVGRRVLVEQCAMWGMRADTAHTEARTLIRLHAACKKNTPYGMVLIDNQDGGIDPGVIAAQVCQSPELAGTLLVLLTGDGERGEAQGMLERGFSAYLTRPLREAEIRQALETLWRARLQGDETGLVTRHSIAESREAVRPEEADSDTQIPARVLLAEDDFVNQQVATEILTSLGCVVTLACDGREAVARALTGPYDVIFMDCHMPKLDGFDATVEIRQAGKKTPIVAMTARAMQGDREACLKAGMDDYLSKPIEPDAVSRVLRQWIQGDAAEAHEPEEITREEDYSSLVLDLEQAMAITGGRVDMLRRVCSVFLTHTPTRLEELGAAVDHNDLDEVARLAHSIQGAAASLGGRRVWSVALKMELEAGKHTIEDPTGAFAMLQSEYARLDQALQNLDWDALEARGGGSLSSIR